MGRTVCEPAPEPRADRCPGSLALHEAQDGWLARVRIPGGRVESDQLRALASAAALGSGLVEVTSRANLQLRGLTPSAAPELAAIMSGARLLPSPPHDRVRNVIASPVGGRHPDSRGATDGLVSAIDRALCADPGLTELPGRFLFAVDDGSGLALDHVADVALVARDGQSYALAIAGQLTADWVPAGRVAASAVATAAAFLEERSERNQRAWRIGELDRGAEAIASRMGTKLTGTLQRNRSLMPGRLEQRDGRAAITALCPLGRLDGQDLAVLAELAPEVRFGTRRTMTVIDIDPSAATDVEQALTALSLVLEPGSGWVGLTACAGLGRCPNARLDVRAAAAARTQIRRAGAPAEHWAACERRCGERPGEPIAVTAMPDGIAVRIDGTERVVASLSDAIAVLP